MNSNNSRLSIVISLKDLTPLIWLISLSLNSIIKVKSKKPKANILYFELF